MNIWGVTSKTRIYSKDFSNYLIVHIFLLRITIRSCILFIHIFFKYKRMLREMNAFFIECVEEPVMNMYKIYLNINPSVFNTYAMKSSISIVLALFSFACSLDNIDSILSFAEKSFGHS